MKVYLSGPISLGGTATQEAIGRRIDAFSLVAARLREFGHKVENPAELGAQESWEAYMRLCLPLVCDADVVATLPDWEYSRGARLEVFVARELKTPVMRAEEIGRVYKPSTKERG